VLAINPEVLIEGGQGTIESAGPTRCGQRGVEAVRTEKRGASGVGT